LLQGKTIVSNGSALFIFFSKLQIVNYRLYEGGSYVEDGKNINNNKSKERNPIAFRASIAACNEEISQLDL